MEPSPIPRMIKHNKGKRYIVSVEHLQNVSLSVINVLVEKMMHIISFYIHNYSKDL